MISREEIPVITDVAPEIAIALKYWLRDLTRAEYSLQ